MRSAVVAELRQAIEDTVHGNLDKSNSKLFGMGYTSFASLPPASALGHPWPSDVHIDHYGRTVPKPAHGSVNLGEYTSSSKLILDAIVDLYERITQPDLLVRRVTVTANHVISEKDVPKPEDKGEQLDLFTDYIAITAERERADNEERKEKSLQHAMIAIKHKFGKNTLLMRDGYPLPE